MRHPERVEAVRFVNAFGDLRVLRGSGQDARYNFPGSTHTAGRGVMFSRKSQWNPLGRGEGRQALEWVVDSGTDPPRLPSASTPPERGFS